jgi:predicted metalloprotease
MRAANAIGDDTIMRNAGQRPVESMFTHGTSEQRMEALQRGLQSSAPSQCNYFQGIF